jgi:V8-like Glu-specific endopeptidase
MKRPLLALRSRRGAPLLLTLAVALGLWPAQAGAQVDLAAFEALMRNSAPKHMPQTPLGQRMPGVPPTQGQGSTGSAKGKVVGQMGQAPGSGPGGKRGPATIRRGTRCVTKRSPRRRVCSTYKRGRLIRKCTTRKRIKRCTYYLAGKATKRCTTKRGKRKCKRLRRKAKARAATLNWQTWPGNVIPQVGFLLFKDGGSCSGTVIAPTLVLTAGHCVWGAGGYTAGAYFVPGMTWDNPGDPYSTKKPYGVWETYSNHIWTPQDFANGDFSQDWAIVEIGPQNGQLLGNVTGWWDVTWGLTWNEGAHVQAAGYPSDGYWATADGLHGRGQWVCDSSWDDGYWTIGTGYELWLDCSMNRGSSGGPWFVQLSDGSWTISGVNSQCAGGNRTADTYCVPWGTHMRTSYFESRFGAFWQAIQPLRGWG